MNGKYDVAANPLGFAHDLFAQLAKDIPVLAHDALSDIHLLCELGVEGGQLDAIGRLDYVKRVALFDPQPI